MGVVAVTWIARPAEDGVKSQVGYATGRRVGPSVVRNRVRRQLQAIMAEIAEDLAPGIYLVSAGSKSSEMHFHGMRGNVWKALQRLGALPEELETYRNRPRQ